MKRFQVDNFIYPFDKHGMEIEFREIKNIWINVINDTLNKNQDLTDLSDNRVKKENTFKET